MKLQFLVTCELVAGAAVEPNDVQQHLQDSLENNQAFRMGINQETVLVMPFATTTENLLKALVRLRDLDVNCSQQEDKAAWAQAHDAIAAAQAVGV